MPTSTLSTIKPLQLRKGVVDHLVIGNQNVYHLMARGLVYTARATNFARRTTTFLPDGQGWAGSAFAGTAQVVFGADHYPFFASGGPNLTLPAAAGTIYEMRPEPSKFGRSEHIAVGHVTTPFLSIYNRETNTKLSNPATLPPGNVLSVAWSPDGEYIAVGGGTSPFLTVYQITKPSAGADFTFTKLANPGTLPSTTVEGVCFSPPSVQGVRYLAVAVNAAATNNIMLYSVSGTTITHVSSHNSQGIGVVYDICWSPSGAFLATAEYFALVTQPYVGLYGIGDGGTLTDASLTELPAGTHTQAEMGITWSADERFVLASGAITPFLTAFPIDGSNFRPALPNPGTLPTAGAMRIDCVPVDRFGRS